MSQFFPFIKKAIALVETENLISTLQRSQPFFDEPKAHTYAAEVNTGSKYFKNVRYLFTSGGLSFTSPEEALSKCLGEFIERFSHFHLFQKRIKFAKYSMLKNAFDPSFFLKNKGQISSTMLGWIKGYNITESTEAYIPAQLLYLSYPEIYNEPHLTVSITTGAAGGFDHESTLQSGIFEAVERDAIMTVYLGKIKVPRIAVETIQHKQVKKIHSLFQKYYIDIFLYDVTNDLEVPTFMTILFDSTGLGPAMTFGSKSSYNPIEAILGSIDEAFMGRYWLRHEMIKRKTNIFPLPSKNLTSRIERGLLWSSHTMVKHIDFLLKQKAEKYQPENYNYLLNETSLIVNSLKRKGFQIYYADIISDIFKSLDYKVYKVIIPGLQQLHLNEAEKEYNVERITTVSNYFHKTNIEINKIPHPFL